MHKRYKLIIEEILKRSGSGPGETLFLDKTRDIIPKFDAALFKSLGFYNDYEPCRKVNNIC